MNIYSLITYFDKARKLSETRYQACCPAHGDKTPSMSIYSDNGKILIHCFAGCSTESIMSAIGLPMSELFEDDNFDKEKYKQEKQREEKKKGFIHCFNVIALAESDQLRGRELSPNDRKTVREAYRELNGYKFDAVEAHHNLLRQKNKETALDMAYYEWTHKTPFERYGVHDDQYFQRTERGDQF